MLQDMYIAMYRKCTVNVINCVLDLGNVQDTSKVLIPQEVYRKFHVSLPGTVQEMCNF